MTQLPKHRSRSRDLLLNFCVCSISPEPFGRFSLNFIQMFLSVRRCTEPMTPQHRLKVTLQSHGIYPSIRVSSISPEPFERFSLNFTQMFISVTNDSAIQTQCQGHTSRSRNLPLNFMSFKSPQPFVRFSFLHHSNVPLNELV